MSRTWRVAIPSFLLGAASMQWAKAYRSYRIEGKATTAYERDLLSGVDRVTYSRHYNERVPTIEEEFEWWGRFHQHRHEMRYDLVADAVREHLRPGGVMLDVGCGAGLVADRLSDLDASYVGLDFSQRNVSSAPRSSQPATTGSAARFLRGDAERLPFPDASVDVVVMSEVIEHLLRPELAV